MNKFNLVVINTGGTIVSSSTEGSAGGISPDHNSPDLTNQKVFEHIKEQWPFSSQQALRIIPGYTSLKPSLSENFAPFYWDEIASTIYTLCLGPERITVDAVLIIHGTDTMTYTASALSFIFASMNIPIIITGSMIPLGQPDSDAISNIYDSLVAAKCLKRGVYIAFAEEVFRGTKVRKVGIGKNAFNAVGREPVARIEQKTLVFTSDYDLDDIFHSQGHSVLNHTKHVQNGIRSFNSGVLAFFLYPGLNLRVMNMAASHEDIHGIVIQLYPSGTGPTQDKPRHEDGLLLLPDFIKMCDYKEKPVFLTLPEPSRNLSVYKSTAALLRGSGVFLHDMLTEVAIVKLMWALSMDRLTKNELINIMRAPIAGEISSE